ncbi:hypothetical protein Alsa2_CDS0167 [Staphylococcus phage Alsa_2]|nr:hypothetical protein Alsa2_CDS0167 [Staphylococcus phage Alsa_2]
MKTTANLFDIRNTYENLYTNIQTGEVETKKGWFTTRYIKVNNGVDYARNKNAEIVAFDSDLNYYGSYGNGTKVIRFSKDISYIRLNIQSKNIENFQFEENSSSTDYTPYGIISHDLKIFNENITDNSITTSNILDNSITSDKVDFIEQSNNLFNSELLTMNTNLTDTNITQEDTNYVVSDYIRVDENETYQTNNKYFGYVVYDINKKYITGRGQYLDNVTIPKGGAYIRLAILNKWLPGFQFFNSKQTNVGSYYLGIKDNPTITEPLAKKLSYNRQTFVKDTEYNDYEVIDVLHNSDILATTSRVLENYSRLYKSNTLSYDMDSLGRDTSEVRFTPKNKLDLMGTQELLLTVFIEDVTQIKNITVNIPKEGGGGSWERSETNLKNGWNRIRLFASEGNLDNWTQARMIRVILYTKDTLQAKITISDLKVIKPQKQNWSW